MALSSSTDTLAGLLRMDDKHRRMLPTAQKKTRMGDAGQMRNLTSLQRSAASAVSAPPNRNAFTITFP